MQIRIWTAVLGMAACSLLRAESLSVCWVDRVGLDPATIAILEKEFAELALQQNVTPGSAGICRDAAVSITIRREAPAKYARALGLAYQEAGRVLPRLELYWNPLIRHLGEARARSVVGRALARVAAHELAHYTRQQSGHDCRGLLSEAFRPASLAAPDPAPFLLARQ